MTQFTYSQPTDKEIRQIYANAQRMRAEATRDGFRAMWNALRGLFGKHGATVAAR